MTIMVEQLDAALAEASALGLTPTLFKVRVSPAGMSPTAVSKHKASGVPIDVTSQASHLLCDGGRRIWIEGEW